MTPDEQEVAQGIMDEGLIETVLEFEQLKDLIKADWLELLRHREVVELDVGSTLLDDKNAPALYSIAWLRGYSQHVNKSRTPPKGQTYIG